MDYVCCAGVTPPVMPKTTPARLDYSFDWGEWLLPGDALTGFEFSLGSPNSATAALAVDAEGRDGAVCTAWLVGGENGVKTPLRCRVTTAQGRTEERTIVIWQVFQRGA